MPMAEPVILELAVNGGLRLGDVDFSEAATRLEHFGLVRGEDSVYEVSAQLFRDWLERR